MASSSMIHSASAASSSRSYKYDIFLSFRGEDTRKTYVDHLYSSLIQHRLVTYKDDETLPRGASISQSLLEAIEQSRIALVIFSKNYADSSWCLDELAHIMECKKEVMPIFYDVDPSDVRKQTGDFGKAFAQQEAKNNSRAQVWRDALVDVSKIAGWEPKNITNGHESKGIKEIVDAVLGRLFPPLNTYVDEALVGMKTRLQDLKSHLEIGAPGVLMVGIWGLGGFLRVVSYAAGLPLALKVLGLFLYDKEEEWMSALDRLKDIPETKIVDKLKVSYNGLKDVEKELFLDIACFWRGAMKDDAMEALEACGFHPTIGIEVLRQKALLTVTEKGRFDMHDLIQEMGHYIVRGEHPNNPENHSRVWKISEIRNMCVGDATTENNMIQAIKFTRDDYRRVEWTQSELCKLVTMRKLRYLDVVEGPIFLSNDLRFLKWDGYYGRSPFSNTVRPTNLRVLRLRFSFQKQLWKDNTRLPHLKVLELCDMHNLVSTPDFDGLPCLQQLQLSFCPMLKEIHPSLGNHTSLEHVYVSFCRELRRFPTIVRMKNLKTLIIRYCANILEFPEIKADMESLVELSLKSVGLEVVPSSIVERCTNLTFLELSSLDNLKSIEFNLDALEQLEELRVTEVKQPVKTIRRPLYHQILGKLGLNTVQGSNSQELSLYHNVYSRLDFSQTHVSQLKVLNLTGCKNLVKLPDLPSSLNILIAGDCESLVTLGDGYKNCIGLCEVALGGSIISDEDTLLEFMLGVCIANKKSCMLLQLMGIEVTKGFLPPFRRGGRCRLELPKNWCNDFSGFLMYVVQKRDPISWSRMSLEINMNETSSGMDYEDDMKEMSNRGMYYYKDDVVWKESDGDFETCVGYVSFASLRETTWWDQTYKALNFSINEGRKFRMTGLAAIGGGVRLVEKKNGTGLKETSTKSSSHYTPRLKIKDDSKSALSISLSPHKEKLVFPDFADKSISYFHYGF